MLTLQNFDTTEFAPDALMVMSAVFDDVWATLEPGLAGTHEAGETKLAQVTLAQRIISLAKQGHTDFATLRAMSLTTLTVATRNTATGS